MPPRSDSYSLSHYLSETSSPLSYNRCQQHHPQALLCSNNNIISNNSSDDHSSFSSISCSIWDPEDPTSTTKQQRRNQHPKFTKQLYDHDKKQLQYDNNNNNDMTTTTCTTTTSGSVTTNGSNENSINPTSELENFPWDCTTIEGSIHIILDFLEKNDITYSDIQELRNASIIVTNQTTNLTTNNHSYYSKRFDNSTSNNNESRVSLLSVQSSVQKVNLDHLVYDTKLLSTIEIICTKRTKLVQVLIQAQQLGDYYIPQNDTDISSSYEIMICLLVNAWTVFCKDLYNHYKAITKLYRTVRHVYDDRLLLNHYDDNDNITSRTPSYALLISNYDITIGRSLNQTKQLQKLREYKIHITELYCCTQKHLLLLQQQRERRIKALNRRLEV